MLEIMAVGKQVEFSIYGGIQGQNSYSGTVTSIVDGRYLNTASSAEVNHINIYPTLPTAQKELYPDLFYGYTYYIIRKDDGTDIALGEAWIIPNTLKEVVPVVCTIVLTDFDETKQTQLQLLLEQANFTISDISVVK